MTRSLMRALVVALLAQGVVGFNGPKAGTRRGRNKLRALADFEERAKALDVTALSQKLQISGGTGGGGFDDLAAALERLKSALPSDAAGQEVGGPGAPDLGALTKALDGALGALQAAFPDVASLVHDLLAQLPVGTPPVLPAVLSLAVGGLVLGGLADAPLAPAEPYATNGRYDPGDAERFFKARRGQVVARALRIGALSAAFGAGLLADRARGLEGRAAEDAARKRAADLVGLLTALGPTFIKIGQSLSIRSDLLSPVYLEALAGLQDRVPAFPSDEAKKTLAQELNVRDANQVFSELSEVPVAAASLGQVYRGRLRADGREVAVKVQRPDIVESVALDMYLIRTLGPALKALFGLSTDVVGTVDDWGKGFVDELDYAREAANALAFNQGIARTPLGGTVFAPPVVLEASARRVLTTEWVVGERIEKSPADQVEKFCSICMNTYLTMLLELGTLHADPHPGNLLVTPEGTLCILDWGLVTEVAPNIQIQFIEHVAHLTSRDYAKVPADLVALGFVPPDKEQAILETECVDVLTEVYSQFAGGGGAAKIDVNFVITQLTGLSEKYGNLFQVPPYFAYIARAFGVLEGIGLGSNPDYAIVGECLPYISQRLLTDPSPRVGGALENFVFGADASDPDRVLDAGRLELILEGFTSYSNAAAGMTAADDAAPSALPQQAHLPSALPSPSASWSATPANPSAQAPLTKELTKEEVGRLTDVFLDLLVTEEATPLQALLLDQVARVSGAAARKAFYEARKASSALLPPQLLSGTGAPGGGGALGGRSLLGLAVDPLGLWRGSGLVDLDATDDRALKAAAKLAQLVQQSPAFAEASHSMRQLQPRDLVVVVEALAPRLWAKRGAVALGAQRFAGVLLQQGATRLERRRSEQVDSAPRAASPAPAASAPAPAATAPALGSVGARPPAAEEGPSRRLEKARELLQGLEV